MSDKQYYYAISYTCCGGCGADYFNGFRQHKTRPHLMIKESKSIMVRQAFMKWKNYGNNGRTKVDRATFKWLLDMAKYIVYHATIGTDFSEE